VSFFHRALLLSIIVVLWAVQPQGDKQPAALTRSAPQAKRLPDDLCEFFLGEWSGAGEFASGKKIEADVSFTPDLDRHWMAYRHTDRPPNRYKALGVWGIDKDSGRLLMLVNDNFGGARLFMSDGWLNGKIVFQKATLVTPVTNQERFTFERKAKDSFRMTYEVSADGKTWRLGDYLNFIKRR